MISRDVKATAEALDRAVEEYGSVSHLANDLGVSFEQLQSWRREPATMPVTMYYNLIELLARLQK